MTEEVKKLLKEEMVAVLVAWTISSACLEVAAVDVHKHPVLNKENQFSIL
jgi:hypothetical protein